MNREIVIENLLRTHPGVHDAAVIRDGRNGIRAFVAPENAYIDSVLDRRNAESAILGKWRKTFDLTQFTKDASSSPAGFSTLGWNSSYTRQAIPSEEIREWVETTVDSIFQLEPKSIYEIGCGTGMLLMRIAPHCDRYVAVDFSQAVLDRVRDQIQATPSVAERVELMRRTADEFDGLDHDSFDAVVINSVAQYFPNAAYLTQVLQNAVNIVKPGGHVFIGDLRSLPLLPAFASSVELFQAANEVTIADLRDRTRRRIQMEHELVLSPAYFMSLQRLSPRISSVEIQPRRGRADNEMSRYRYNAILHVGHEREAPSEVAFLDCSEIGLTVDEIRSLLQRRPGDYVGIKRIPNSRLATDLDILGELRSSDMASTAETLRRAGPRHVVRGIDPQDIVDLETDPPVQVCLSWAACREDGSYDALFLPRSERRARCSIVNWPQPDLSGFVHLANAPGQAKLRGELLDQLLSHCRKNLPEELVPGNITLVDTLVRAPDGDVDSRALLAARSASSWS